MTSDLARQLLAATPVSARLAPTAVPDRPGFYSIWIDEAGNLPAPFSTRLMERDTTLIYVGIATRSLLKRLVRQDLHHESPSTFFRSLGAVLGHRPPRGSLAHRKNKRNYEFSDDDTGAIRAWVNEHLSVRWVESAPAPSADERLAIGQLRPLLNIQHNPDRMVELQRLRKECVTMACGSPEG